MEAATATAAAAAAPQSNAAPMSTNLANYPLKEIPQPHPHDVLCGRGGGTNNHIGNSHWRMLVAANKQLYITLPKRQKMLLSRSIVNAVRSQNPPGRFLQKDTKTDLWYDVGDQRAQEKTSQALREGAPDIRHKLASQRPQDSTDEYTETPGDFEGADEEQQEQQDDDNVSSPKKKKPPPPAENNVAPSSKTPSSQPIAAAAAPLSPRAPKTEAPAATMPSAHGNMPPSTGTTPHARADSSPVASGGGGGGGGTFMPMPQQQQQQRQHSHNNKPQAATLDERQQQQQQLPQVVMPYGMNGGNIVTHQTNEGPVMFYTAPGMAPMPMYPTMVLNEQGMMVQAMSLVPPPIPPHVPPQGPTTDRKSKKQAASASRDDPLPPNLNHAESGETALAHNRRKQQQRQQQQVPVDHHHHHHHHPQQQQVDQHHHHHQQQHHDVSNPQSYVDPKPVDIPDFDDAQILPPGFEPAGLSFGSISMSMASVDHMDSSVLGALPQHAKQQPPQQQPLFGRKPADSRLYNDNKAQYKLNTGDDDNVPFEFDAALAAPTGDMLEPTGVSFGEISAMSFGDTNKKLEATGTSFGSVMSFSVNTVNNQHPKVDMVDGGLEAIGTSFGSLSLNTMDQSKISAIDLEPTPIPPTFLQQQRSTANLLECSDSEEEDEEDAFRKAQKKSADWEQLKATLATQNQMAAQQQQHDANAMPAPTQPLGGQMPVLNIPNMLPFPGDFQGMQAPGLYPNFSELTVEGGYDIAPPADDRNAPHDGRQGNHMPPPPPMKKGVSDIEKIEMMYLKRGNSLASEDFVGPESQL